MHQIQKLDIIGFKSFCDKTQVLFHEGCTAIVGPNGCGKSNIADAISWVVGEQSAKSLRTDRMEGVIFNGTQARKPTGFAEVVLTMQLAPNFTVPENLSLRPEGFTVGRRLYRSGESEYYLEGRKCRLKDIQALFEGTGLGHNSYAIIEQGRISQILSSKPADRRSLIEEAARVTLFKSRRYSAEAKLELARQNLLRVNDIVREVERQLNSLRRQAAKARRYARLREELRGIHRLRMGLSHRQLQEKLRECLARYRGAREQEQEILARLARQEGARAAAQESCRLEEETLNGFRETLAGLRLEAGNAGNSRMNQENRRASLEGRLEELAAELRAVSDRSDLALREKERLGRARLALEQEIAGEQQALETEQSRSEAVQEAIRETERKMEETRLFLINRAGKLTELHNLQVRCQENLSRIEARTARLEEERKVKAGERTAFEQQLAAARQMRNEAEIRHAEVARSLAEQENRSSETARRCEEVSSDLAAKQEEHSIGRHRLSSLEEIERRRSNYSEGVQKFLSARVPGEEQLKARTLADCVETDASYESAVEDYLNDPLQYILVDGMDEAVKNVERVRQVGAGRCTFMTLRNGHRRGELSRRPAVSGEGVVGYLDEILRMREDVRHAFERALPEYASTIMVTDLPTAFRLAEERAGGNFLTLAGEAYSPRGTLAAAGERKSMAGFLALKREKRELEGRLSGLRGGIEAARAEQARLKQEQAAVAEALKQLAGEARRLDIELVGLRLEVERLESEIRKAAQGESVAAAELAQLAEEKARFEAGLRQADAGIAEAEERGRSGDADLKFMAARLDMLRSESTGLARKLSQLLSEHAVKKERLAGADNELRRLGAEGEELRRKAESHRAEETRTREEIASLGIALQQADARLAELAGGIEQAEAGQAERQQVLAARRSEVASLEEESRRLHACREEAMETRSAIEIDKTRLESELDHLGQSCIEEYHRPLEEIVAEIGDEQWQSDFDEVRRAYDELREKVENFGAINMRALEEYQELEERYRFLVNQRADIEQSIADTQKAIAEINRRSLEQFRDAFDNIRRNFHDVFKMLFRGGQCDLRLLDETDILESGVDIIAQPPGKKLQNILLLSGGEKALTALALLIAIFRYRPSPFCVLDEVDAPLDDANVQRFASLISELSKETQFILVTHNKKTMEVADFLYGVTMEEPGVSKIVGVDFRPRAEARAS